MLHRTCCKVSQSTPKCSAAASAADHLGVKRSPSLAFLRCQEADMLNAVQSLHVTTQEFFVRKKLLQCL